MEEQATFKDFGFNKQIITAIEEKGYEQPTPVQLRGIPPILNGQDTMVLAQTGTGKTAAYLLPIIMQLKYPQGEDPRAIIVVPTRELALQVRQNALDYGKYTGLRIVALYGGTGIKGQKEELEQGADIIIATPGRLWDFYLSTDIVFKKVRTFVLDEADKLMDMGFLPQIHRLLEVMPKKKQNILLSATLSDLVKRIAGDFLEFPTEIFIEPDQKTAVNVSQSVYRVPNFQTKLNLLMYLLTNTKDMGQSIIFCRSKANAERLYKLILDLRLEAKIIHSNKDQNSRLNAMYAFRDGEVQILIATDVVSRGIDISSVTHVFNFDIPIQYNDYIHRIGRTGRASNQGHSITFCLPSEEYHLLKIQEIIRQKIQGEEIPKEVIVAPTAFEEQQEILRELDIQKRKEDPDFKGAFHEKKKWRNPKPPRSSTKQSKRGKRR